VVLSADERYLYAVNFYGRSLSRADLKTHEITELDLVTDPKYVNVWAGCLGLAPDGRKLVVTLGSDNRTVDENNDQVSIIDVADNRFKLVGEVALPDEPLGQTAQMAFSPDGRFAYVYTRARKSNVPVLYEIEVAPPGRISRRVRMPGADLRGVAVSGKQRRLFVSDFAGRKIRVFDLESLRPVVDISTAELGPSDLAVYDDRDLGVVVCEQNRTLFCFDTAGGSAVAAVKNLRKYVVDVEFSPDGSRLFVANSRQQPGIGLIDLDELLTRLVFASNRGGESFQVYTAWSDGSAPLRLTSNHATDLFPRWSPDGRRIALVSDRMGLPKVFVMDRDGANTVVLDQTDPVMLDDTGPTIDWSPDGHTIAFIGDERRAIRIVDIATGEIKTLLAGEAGRGYGCHIALSWRSADGSLLFISRSPELGTNQDVFQLDPTSGHVVQVTDNWGTPEYSRSVAASRDTKLVAIVRCDFNYPRKDGLCILRGDDAELAGIASVAAGQYTAVEWYPRGDRLVYSAREGEYAHLYAIDTDGKAPLQLTEGEHDDAFPDVCRILPGDRGDPQNRRNAAPELDGDK
jgi:Tol biopolymer transport system component